ncbi:MAG TPA: diguanylate cyclase, partial [Thiobacillus sp.]
MRPRLPPPLVRLAHALRPAQLSTQGRVVGATLFVLIAVFALAGQQALHIARQDADAALHVQATAQLAALSQAVAEPAIRGDDAAVQTRLRIPLDQGNLRQVEYTAPDGRVLRQQARPPAVDRPDWFARLTRLALPVMQQDLIIQGSYYGSLRIQPSSHAYEDFLWHLGTRLFLLLGLAIALLVWLTRALLRINLKDLIRLSATARRIEAGDYSVRLPIRAGSPPELQESARAFNFMSAALERLLTDLGEQQKALDSAASVSESDLAGNITFANDLFCIISGYTREELIGQNHRIVNSGMHDPAFFSNLWGTITSGRTWRGEICNRAKDGRLFWTASTIIPIKGDDGLPLKYLSIRFDITQRKLDEAALSTEKERWQVTLQSINDAVVVTNAHNQVTYLNPAAESLLGLALEDALLNSLSDVMRLDQMSGDEEAPACFLSSAAALHGQTGSAQLHTRFGQHLAISYSCAPLNEHGALGAVYVLRDETEKKVLLDNLREMAFHDTLTTLPNRRAVEGRLARALHTARDLGQQHAFCYIDLDQFKLVNDTCGHSVGDALLADIAQTMKAALPAQAYLGRLGGDEFGLILFDTRPDEANRICRQLVQRIRDFRFEHKGRRFTLGACAG